MPLINKSVESSLEDVAERGLAVYEKVLKEGLERDHLGEIVAIHPDSGDYIVARHRQDAIRRLHAQHPKGMMFVTRVGPPTLADLSVIERIGYPGLNRL